MKYTVWLHQKNNDFAVYNFYSAKEADNCLELGIRLGMKGWIMAKDENDVLSLYRKENIKK